MASETTDGPQTPTPDQHLHQVGRELTKLLDDAERQPVEETLATSVEAIEAVAVGQPLADRRRPLRESICHMLLQMDATLRELEGQLSPGDRSAVQRQRVRITTAAEALVDGGDGA